LIAKRAAIHAQLLAKTDWSGGRFGASMIHVMKKLSLLAIPAAFALALTTNAFAADGKAVYSESCAKCHGEDGKGATKMGTKLGARDYTDAAVQAAFTDEQAFKSIKEGMKKDEKTLMKPSELADEDIKASVTYMRTFKK
jgi:mono/diheme cytochrome c family protein